MRGFDDIPFSELKFLADQIDKRRAREVKNQMVAAAYTAWLINPNDEKTFGSYLKKVGLSESKKISAPAKEAITKRAHSIAERIMAMDKKRNVSTRTAKKKGAKRA